MAITALSKFFAPDRRFVAGFATAGAITAIAYGAMAAMQAVIYFRNSDIKTVDCALISMQEAIIDVPLYRRLEMDNALSVMQQHCLGRYLEKKEQYIEARGWYNKAAERGLAAARDMLCRKEMFPERGVRRDFPEFEKLCCPPLTWSSCPWHHAEAVS